MSTSPAKVPPINTTPSPARRRTSRTPGGRNIMQSLLSKGKAFLTPNASSTNLSIFPSSKSKSRGTQTQTAKTPTQLFPATDPAVDGEDCLHDCASCTVVLPRKWEIDESDPLYGHINGWDTHIIVATGKTDWVRDIEDEKGSLMEKIGRHGLKVGNGKAMLSASDMPTGNDHHEDVDEKGQSTYQNNGRTRCLVLPRWSMVEGVGRDDVAWLMDEVVGKSASNTSPLRSIDPASSQDTTTTSSAPTATPNTPSPAPTDPTSSIPTLTQPPPSSIPHGISLTPSPHRALILLCSHKTRDWRCGASAPLLRREFERHLRTHNLYRDAHDSRPGGVGVYFINHVGGHRYSANVMVYRRCGAGVSLVSSASPSTEGVGGEGEGGGEQVAKIEDEAVQGIWLARVRPEDCENVVRYTVLMGKVVKPERQLRGGFDRGAGLVSW